MKYIVFLLCALNIFAFRPVYSEGSLEYSKSFKSTRVYFENKIYYFALEDKLKDSNLSETEINYLKDEIKITKERLKPIKPLEFTELSFANNSEVELYKDILDKKDFDKNHNTYKFYTNLILDNLVFVEKFPKNPNQIMAFEGKGEVLGNELKGDIIFTFDDGPSKYTDKITQILDEYDIKGIFFVLGNRIDPYKDKIKEMIDVGHTIGFHSVSHKNLINIGEKEVEVEVSFGKEKILNEFSYETKYFRSPYGSRNEKVLDIINESYENHILWNIDSVDWHKGFTQDIIIERVLRLSYLYDGGIILFHDINKKTPNVLGEIIEKLKNGGFNFTSKI